MKTNALLSVLVILALAGGLWAQPAAPPAPAKAPAPAAPAAGALQATVVAVTGSAEKRDGSKSDTKWTAVKVKDVLGALTLLRTGFGSSITIQLADRGVLTLRNATGGGLGELVKKGQVVKADVGLKYGSANVKLDHTRGPNDFSLSTSTAVLSLRGSKYNIASSEFQTHAGSHESTGRLILPLGPYCGLVPPPIQMVLGFNLLMIHQFESMGVLGYPYFSLFWFQRSMPGAMLYAGLYYYNYWRWANDTGSWAAYRGDMARPRNPLFGRWINSCSDRITKIEYGDMYDYQWDYHSWQSYYQYYYMPVGIHYRHGCYQFIYGPRDNPSNRYESLRSDVVTPRETVQPVSPVRSLQQE